MGRRWRRTWGGRYDWGWPRYVPVAERRAKAERRLEQLKKKGEKLDPVKINGRTIACTFWGKAWCDHLESHSDFWNRLPRGRSYVRNGSVCDLVIKPGRVDARVVGTSLYNVEIDIKKLPKARWTAIRKSCAGGIASVIELLQGRLSDAVMRIITHRTDGLFPRPSEIELRCSCPDYATMCKHVAATLYGVGARLDDRPELLFVLRGVDHLELVAEAVRGGALAEASASGPAGLEESELAEVFGVDIETVPHPPAGKEGMVKKKLKKKKGKKRKPKPGDKRAKEKATKKHPGKKGPAGKKKPPPGGNYVSRRRFLRK
ncbi:MAG: SWIM zinc finger family protein [Candidatus Aminicenantales bacterium]